MYYRERWTMLCNEVYYTQPWTLERESGCVTVSIANILAFDLRGLPLAFIFAANSLPHNIGVVDDQPSPLPRYTLTSSVGLRLRASLGGHSGLEQYTQSIPARCYSVTSSDSADFRLRRIIPEHDILPQANDQLSRSQPDIARPCRFNGSE